MASKLLMTFDKYMADPSGYHSEFTATKIGAGVVDLTDVQAGVTNISVITVFKENYTNVYAVKFTEGGQRKLNLYGSSSLLQVGHMTPENTLGAKTLTEGAQLTLKWGNTQYDVGTATDYSNITSGWTDAYNIEVICIKGADTDIHLTPTSIALNSSDHKILELSIAESIEYGDIIKLNYTRGMISTPEYGWLESFTNYAVTNEVVEV